MRRIARKQIRSVDRTRHLQKLSAVTHGALRYACETLAGDGDEQDSRYGDESESHYDHDEQSEWILIEGKVVESSRESG